MWPESTKPVSKIAIIGVGQVGAAAAYALILGNITSEILLVDIKLELRDAQVRDLSDVAYRCNNGTRVLPATSRDASQCDIVIVTAGSKHSRGETSLLHLYQKTSMIRSIINGMKPFKSDTILLIVANPVDLLTSIAKELCGLPASQVIGSGTFLDSVRLRALVADKAKIAASSINIFILGVHGDSQVTAWSTATIGGVPMNKLLTPSTVNHAELEAECKRNSQNIIQSKGSTPFGIGCIITSICSSILLDKRDVRPLSHFQPQFSCCFSLPIVLGRKGIIKTVQMPLSEDENAKIASSARELKTTLDQIHVNQ
ncbi:hypothetical protein N7540_003606 [Penicillium herquei]|nr:hypothetical protein N7540_003606 [Penicillium herquei]